jgi:hypothetical protein
MVVGWVGYRFSRARWRPPGDVTWINQPPYVVVCSQAKQTEYSVCAVSPFERKEKNCQTLFFTPVHVWLVSIFFLSVRYLEEKWCGPTIRAKGVAKLFGRGWMESMVGYVCAEGPRRWLAAGIAIYAHQMKREMTSNIFLLHGLLAECIYRHSSELGLALLFFNYFLFLVFYSPSPFFPPGLTYIVLISIYIEKKCSRDRRQSMRQDRREDRDIYWPPFL